MMAAPESHSVHDALNVYIEPHAVVLDAPSGEDGQCLSIRRPDGACKLVARPPGGWGGGRAPAAEAVGVVGLLQLPSGAHLMLVTRASRAAHAPGYAIWQASAFEVLPLGEPSGLPRRLRREEAALVAGVRSHVLGCGSLYFSHEHDLTHSAQRIATRLRREQPLCVRADPRFFFNRAAAQPLLIACAHRWVVVLVQGFVHQQAATLSGRPFDVLTLARRASRRAGARFHRRGVDGGGCVAQWAEVEQVLLCGGALCSHVQLRGSAPLSWAQPPRLMVGDALRSAVLSEGKQGSAGCAAHLVSLIDEYGPQVSTETTAQPPAPHAARPASSHSAAASSLRPPARFRARS